MTGPLDAFRPRNLRTDREGRAINFPVLLDEDGDQIGDFDLVIERRLLYQRRCGVCGDPLGEEFCFLGDERHVNKRKFYNAALHINCAIYAFGNCPFLATPKFKSQHADIARVGPLYMWVTDGYRIRHLSYFIRSHFFRHRPEWNPGGIAGLVWPIVVANPNTQPVRTFNGRREMIEWALGEL